MSVSASKATTSIEEQLALYRNLKRKEEEDRKTRKRIWDYISWIMDLGSRSRSFKGSQYTSVTDDSSSSENRFEVPAQDVQEQSTSKEKVLRRRQALAKDSSSSFSDHDFSQPSFLDSYTTTDWIILGLKVAMWFLLWKIFIILEFGAVFFIFSAFSFIWYNMRSGPKKTGEVSAYSVFNPNCEMIDGTFTAEQFERELLHKM